MQTIRTRVALSRRSSDAAGSGQTPAVPDLSQTLVACVTLGIALAAFLVPLATIPMSPFAFGSLLLFSATLAFVICMLAVLAVTRPRPQTVNVVRDAGLTWFSRSRTPLAVLMVGIALCTTAIAGFSVFIVAHGLLSSGGDLLRAVPRLAWVLAILFAVIAFFSWRELPRTWSAAHGIRLAPESVGITHARREVSLRWEQIASVRSERVAQLGGQKSRAVPCVRITATDGRTFTVEALELGSDATVVAAFILHHRARPAARAWLAEPAEAIRRFSDAQTDASQ